MPPQLCAVPRRGVRHQALPALIVAALCAAAPGASGFLTVDMGSGAGWLDCNNDGFIDLCYLTPDGYVALLVFDPGQGTFVDQTATAFPFASIIQGKWAGMGVACGDFNNDGLDDLFLTYLGPNQLLLNNGDTTFRLVSRMAGIVPGAAGDAHNASSALFDYDNDGDLDIYVTTYGSSPDIGFPDQLFRNDGVSIDGLPHFVDVAPALNMDTPQNGQSRWGLGVAVADYDNDGDMDLYLANDYDGMDLDNGNLKPGADIFYRNEGNGTFTDVTLAAGTGDEGWSMGVAFGDYDRDGWQDLFITNFWEDVLYHNNRNGTFTEVTHLVGMPTIRPDPADPPPCTVCNGWGTAFFDYDNDGDLDIHVANGYIGNSEGQDLDEPDQLWENIGVGTNGHVQFREIGAAAGVDNIGDARGAAYADIDRDGFVDFLVINNNYLGGQGTPVPKRLLYMNQGNGTFREMGQSYGVRITETDAEPLSPRVDLSSNHWIQIRPVGTVSNRNGIGSRITVQAGGKTWVKDVGAGSYLSTNSHFVHFGLGTVDSIDRVLVRFPHGGTATVEDPPLDGFLTVSEDDAVPVRLLAFDAEATPSGARLTWHWSDDGDLTTFAIHRAVGSETVLLAPAIFPFGGWGEYLDRDVPRGIQVLYHLEASYRDGSRERVGTVPFLAPALRALGQNVPNPFTLTTAIPVSVPVGRAAVHIFDASGRLVRMLVQDQAAGTNLLSWDGLDGAGRPVPAGAYYYRLEGTGEALAMIRRP